MGDVRDAAGGWERHYRLDARPLRAVADWAAHYEQFWQRHARMLRDFLEEDS